MSELIRLMREMVKSESASGVSMKGKVISVNESDRTCDVDPLDGSPTIYDAQLQAADGSELGLVYIPKKGSIVEVLMTSNETGVLIGFSELDRIENKIGTQVLIIDKDGLLVKSPISNMAKDVNALLDLMGAQIDLLMQFQMVTPMGPTISVSPPSIVKLTQNKVEIELLREKFKTYLKDA